MARRDDWRIFYCAILGVEPTAGLWEIQQAYRKLVFRYHPDRNPHDPNAAQRFKAVEEAYENLCEPERIKHIGAFHTPASMFLTTRCHSKSPRRDHVMQDTGFFLPFSVMATVAYLMMLAMYFLFSLANAGAVAGVDYYTNSTYLEMIFITANCCYGLVLFCLFIYLPRKP